MFPDYLSFSYDHVNTISQIQQVTHKCSCKLKCFQLFLWHLSLFDTLTYLTYRLQWLPTSDESHSLQLYFLWHNCPWQFFLLISKFFSYFEIFEIFCDFMILFSRRCKRKLKMIVRMTMMHSIELVNLIVLSKNPSNYSCVQVIWLNF